MTKMPLLVYMFEDNGLERPTDMNDLKGPEPMHVDNMICYSIGCTHVTSQHPLEPIV